ncbi:hypothetical protein LOK74_20170 [Brevibacillus humidisoli]|nr:hypothetical protein [Brevibacillus humidisoli]UFJ43444.1 hypothetical protein LOK74_20170 [Brevibacillus humidisoli]
MLPTSPSVKIASRLLTKKETSKRSSPLRSQSLTIARQVFHCGYEKVFHTEVGFRCRRERGKLGKKLAKVRVIAWDIKFYFFHTNFRPAQMIDHMAEQVVEKPGLSMFLGDADGLNTNPAFVCKLPLRRSVHIADHRNDLISFVEPNDEFTKLQLTIEKGQNRTESARGITVSPVA